MWFDSSTVLVPPIFADVKRVKSAFSLAGERTHDDPLGNNMTVADAVVRSGLELAGVTGDFEEAVRRETQRVLERRADFYRFVGEGLSPFVVASPKPATGTDIVAVNGGTIADLQLDSPSRVTADISFVTERGYGSLYAPADCPLIDIVDPRPGGVVMQIHAGWQGLRNWVVREGMTAARERGIDTSSALVHIHPNATEGFELAGKGLDSWRTEFGGDFLTTVGETSYISMTDAAIGQLIEAGIKPDHIQTSSVYTGDKDFNSLVDDRFYSHRAQKQKGFNGRNAGLLVLVDD